HGRSTGNSYESGAGVEYVDDLPIWSQSDEPIEKTSVLDHLSRLWVTYRRDFSQSAAAKAPKTDKGCGLHAPLRQMMLAEAIVRVEAGPSLALYLLRNSGQLIIAASMGGVLTASRLASGSVRHRGPQAIRQAVCCFDQFANLLGSLAHSHSPEALLRSSADSKALLLFVPSAWACPTSTARQRALLFDPHTTQDCRRYRAAVSGVAAAAAQRLEPPPRTPVITVPSLSRMPFAGRLDPSAGASGSSAPTRPQLDDLCASLVRRMVQAVRFAAASKSTRPGEPLAGV
uniref:Uncharacterized protein n=1 Tax=Macrostomum lignano TaxID=282301 RepID=A0A1I8JQ78_9PLAT